MSQPIAADLEALALAKDSGRELHLNHYATTHQPLADIIEAAQNHDRILMKAEACPTGADCDHMMQLLGLRAEATTNLSSISEKESA